MQLNEFTTRLNGVKKTGSQIMAKCPAHKDDTASLAVTSNYEGIGLYCQAGCDTETILYAMGLSKKDLFLKPLDKAQTVSKNIEYIYTDELGLPVHKKIRTPDKKFWQMYFDNGSWVKGKGEKSFLYKLPLSIDAVAKGETIFFVEGEKDADNLIKLGLTATTTPEGAGAKFKESYIPYFKGANVVILPDVDDDKDAGLKHAQKVYKALNPIASSVKIIELNNPTKKKGFDVSDWLQDGGTKEQLLDIVNNYVEPKQVESTAKETQEFKPTFYETPEGYKKLVVVVDKKTKEESEVEIHVAPFIIEPKELISCEDYTELNSTILYGNKEYAANLTAKDFTTPKDFKNSIAKRISPSVWFDGDSKDLTKIQKILEKKKVKKIQGVKSGGFHKLNGEWVYVTAKGALKRDGTITQDIKLLEGYREIDNSRIISQDLLTDIEITKLSINLFNFNVSTITSSFIGYISAIFLKERFAFGEQWNQNSI